MMIPDKYIFKTIPVQFYGKKFSLMTSQELFSCNAVDAGSELLLNSIIKNIDIPQKPLILDTGCGTGVLSLAMLTQYPDATVYALDRDALALAITGMNPRRMDYKLKHYHLLAQEASLKADLISHSIL